MVFLGDDTWTSLFPEHFTVSHPFGSLNTRDLYSVDRSIEEKLFDFFPEVTAEPFNSNDPRVDWTVLIAHFLGCVYLVPHFHSN